MSKAAAAFLRGGCEDAFSVNVSHTMDPIATSEPSGSGDHEVAQLPWISDHSWLHTGQVSSQNTCPLPNCITTTMC